MVTHRETEQEGSSAAHKRSAAESGALSVPCEFWFFSQLSDTLWSALEKSSAGLSTLNPKSFPLMHCLVSLWHAVRAHGVFRPREDPQEIQAKSLDLFCE